MGATYLYAEDSAQWPQPEQLNLLWMIDRFGVMAVLGRPTLSAREIRDMLTAENVFDAYREMKAAEKKEGGWTDWAKANPQKDRCLKQAMMAAHDIAWGDEG